MSGCYFVSSFIYAGRSDKCLLCIYPASQNVHFQMPPSPGHGFDASLPVPDVTTMVPS